MRNNYSVLAMMILAACIGCSNSSPAPPEPPKQAAARVFDLAQKLENERKAKEAFAAYRQIARLYPNTPHGKRAAERIREAQQAALRKPR
jgi:hypothetical protein